jgi:hypothetical protein
MVPPNYGGAQAPTVCGIVRKRAAEKVALVPFSSKASQIQKTAQPSFKLTAFTQRAGPGQDAGQRNLN